MKGSYVEHVLEFNFDARTSRGSMRKHRAFIIKIEDEDHPGYGLGECAPLPGLSRDADEDIPKAIDQLFKKLSNYSLPETKEDILDLAENLLKSNHPSLRFALETALFDLHNGGYGLIYENDFTDKGSPLPINGLIWMGDRASMLDQGLAKIRKGFDCIKMKVGSIGWEEEMYVLRALRAESPGSTFRLDANGAFQAKNALRYLEEYARFDIHSIEQPIAAGQEEEMKRLCKTSPVPIALDEELIHNSHRKEELLDIIRPQFIILKPTLLGGLYEAYEWIKAADERSVGWWITSALESNIGLNTIAQFTFEHNNGMVHGLGTGGLYRNNILSPLEINAGRLYYNKNKTWDFSVLGNLPD